MSNLRAFTVPEIWRIAKVLKVSKSHTAITIPVDILLHFSIVHLVSNLHAIYYRIRDID